MSKYPDHQVQALANAMRDAYPGIAPAFKGGPVWQAALAALEFLGIEPEIPPTVTVVVELPREEAIEVAAVWSGRTADDDLPAETRALMRFAAASREALNG